MKRKRIVWLLTAMFVVQATFPYFMNSTVDAAGSTHLGSKTTSFSHFEDDPGGWAKGGNGNYLQIGGTFIRADVNQLRANWHQALAKDVKLGGIGLDSPTGYTPPTGFKIHSYASYAVYNMRTYDVQKENSGCNGGSYNDSQCNPYYFDGVAGEDNRWAKSPNILSSSHWMYYKTEVRYNAGLKRNMEYYRWRTAQIRKQGSNNGAGGSPWLKYDFKIVPIDSTTQPEPGVPEPNPDPENPEPEGPPPPPPNLPPRVTIDGPTVVFAGEDFCLEAHGEDDDGTVEEYRFNAPPKARQYDNLICNVYLETGDYIISVVAIDDDGASSPTASHKIKVIAPQPSADFYVQGAKKENRKIQLRPVEPYGNKIGVIDAFPMVTEKWTITAVDPANQQQIKTHAKISENISYLEIVDILMKVRGDYKIKRYVKNSIGLDDTVEKIITIQPDYLPVADFDVATKIFRDNVKEKPLQSSATIKLKDTSYSNDDFVDKRIWSYFYDSNNNNEFTDETEVIVSTANETSVNISNLEKVGKYLIQLKIVEEFAQETIDDFVTPEDRRRHEVTVAQTELSIPVKPLPDRTVTVDNLAPNASYDVKEKGVPDKPADEQMKVDVQLALDETPYSIAAVQSGMATLRERLNAENIKANITVDPLRAPLRKPIDIASYFTNAFYLLDSGDVYVSGPDSYSTVLSGTGKTNGANTTPVPVIRSWGDAKAIDVEVKPMHALFLIDNGDVYASGSWQITGGHDYSKVNTPGKVPLPTMYGKYNGISAGHDSSFYLLEQYGAPLATGLTGNTYGQLGIPTRYSIIDWVDQPWGTKHIVQMSSGGAHTLFLDESGNPWATGHNTSGELGIGNTTQQNSPKAVSKPWGSSKKVTQIVAGQSTSYFVLDSGEVYAAGDNYYGQLGIGNNTTSRTPVLVKNPWGTLKVKLVHAGHDQALFLLENGEVYSVGRNDHGKLGDGTTTNRNTPVKVVKTWGDKKVTKLSGGYYHSSLLLETGEVYFMGENSKGVFGNGTSTNSTVPVKGGFDTWNGNREVAAWSESDSDMLFGALVSRGKVDKTTEISNKMLELDADFIGIGTNDNKAQMNEIITRNMDRGLFINDDTTATNADNLERIANELADHIIAKVEKKKTEKEIYLTLEDEAEYKRHFNDEEKDPMISEKWKFDHTPTAFENDMGLELRHMKELANPIEKFAKVGLYRPIFSAKDDPIFWGDNAFDSYRKWSKENKDWSIYVHRKPIPNFSFTIAKDRSYTITNEAYDLDKYSINIGKGPGIRTQKWEWRELNTTNWQNGLPPNPLSNKIYEIKNTVVDFQNKEESLIKLMNASGVNVPPIPLFELVDEIMTDEVFNPIDLSYDPNGDKITDWRWWIKKIEEGDTEPTLDVGFNLIPPQPGKLNGPDIILEDGGKYIVRLQVKDEFELWSTEPSKYAFQIVEVLSANEPPIAGFRVSDTYVGSPLNVISEAIDPDDDILEYSYNVTTPQGRNFVVATGETISDKKGFPIIVDELGNVQLQTYDVEDVGTWTFTQVVTDPDGESATFGPITAEVLPLIITGNVYHTEEWTRIHLTKGNAPNEFYSGEKFLLAAEVSDYPVKNNNVSISGTLENGESFFADVSLNKESSIRYIGDYFEERFSNPGTMIKEGSEVTFTFSVVYENDYEPENYTVNVLIIGNVYDYLNERYHRNYQ